MNISQVIALPEDTWINDGFTGVVREVQEKVAQKTKKKFWVLTLADPKTNEVVEAACFTFPKVKASDQIDVTGSGIKRKDDYNGTVKVSWGEKAEINVIGTNIAHETGAAAAANNDPMPKGNFHTQMKREALLMAHCIYYAAKVVEKIGAAGMTDLSKGLNQPEHIRNMAISLAIRAEKLGLSSIAPALGSPAVSAAPAASTGSATPPPSRVVRPGELTDRQSSNLDDRPGREVHVDEDIPF